MMVDGVQKVFAFQHFTFVAISFLTSFSSLDGYGSAEWVQSSS
jgi:hypothetical protein